MILTCPSCSAQYFADDKAIGENGRTVRCASCSHSWFARPELSLEAEIDASDLSREKVERMRQAYGEEGAGAMAPHMAFREKEFAKKQKGSRLAAMTAWAGTAAIFFGLGAGAVIMRDDVVSFFPEASSAYAMVGLDVNPFGLEFSDVVADRQLDGTTPILTVSGSILNVSDRYQPVPNVRVDLRDDGGLEVESLLITPEATSVAPGEEVHFTSRLDSPSLAAYDLAVTFVESESRVRLVDDGQGVAAAHTDEHYGQDHAVADAEHSTEYLDHAEEAHAPTHEDHGSADMAH